MAYGSTAVNWASYMRELFKVHFHRNTKSLKFSGVVEIDESLFGRRVKHHRGNPNAGLKIWIFGLIERESNRIILYPVSDRSEETLLPLILRHVEPGSIIYSDGWSAYCNLNDAGFNHFTVIHKYSFKKVYFNVSTKEEVVVHTNKIEGAWKHAKSHFRRMSGTKQSQFEGHLAEIMWRNEIKNDAYFNFFDLVRSVYPLTSPPVYTYSTPLFDSWSGNTDTTPPVEWEIMPGNTDAESEVESLIGSSEGGPITLSSDPDTSFPTPLSPNLPRNVKEDNSIDEMLEIFSSTSISCPEDEKTSGDQAEATLLASPEPTASTTRRCRRTRTRRTSERVCHPKVFRCKDLSDSDSDFLHGNPRRYLPRRCKSAKGGPYKNPYAKDAFVTLSDSDDEFV